MANDLKMGTHRKRGISIGPTGVQITADTADPTDSELANGRLAYKTGTGFRAYDNGAWITLGAGGGTTAYDDIGDPDASGSIAMAGYTGTYTSATASWGGVIMSNTHANPTAGANLLSLNYTADGDAQGIFLICKDNASADTKFQIAADGAVTAGAITGVGLDYGSGSLVGTGNIAINTDKLTVTGASGNMAINTNKFTVAGASGNTVIAGDLAVTGAFALNTNKLTVAAATGNTSIAGDLAVAGSLSFGGNWTIGDTLTVDELILDTDGVAPAATNCYAVRDNAGDLTLNAITAKQVHLAIAGADEYDFSASTLDMLANALDNCGFIILNAATAPAGTEVYAVNDNTGDLTLNALTAKKVLLAIAGTDEYGFSGTAFEVASGNTIQFLGNNGIIDSNGNEVIYVEAVAAATTYLNVKNAAGANLQVECLGAVDLGFTFQNDQDEEILILTPVASAVNEITIQNAATTAKPKIQITGEADIGIEILNAAGEIELATASSATPVNWVMISNANTATRPFLINPGEDDVGLEFRAKNNEEMLILATVAAAVNEVTITSAATTGAPSIAASGGDANIDLNLAAKGTGVVAPQGNLEMSGNSIIGNTTAGGDLTISSTSNATKGCATISDGEQGIKVGAVTDRATTEGTNQVVIFNGTAPVGTLANGATFYATAGEMRVMDAAGNSTVISPHTKTGDYIIQSYSAKKKKTLTIHLEKLVEALVKENDKLSKFVEWEE